MLEAGSDREAEAGRNPPIFDFCLHVPANRVAVATQDCLDTFRYVVLALTGDSTCTAYHRCRTPCRIPCASPCASPYTSPVVSSGAFRWYAPPPSHSPNPPNSSPIPPNSSPVPANSSPIPANSSPIPPSSSPIPPNSSLGPPDPPDSNFTNPPNSNQWAQPDETRWRSTKLWLPTCVQPGGEIVGQQPVV